MNPSDIVLLGLKRSVLAFRRGTGERLWEQELPGGGFAGDSFVTLIADDTRVYAHAKGELFCLELATGRVLWHDALTGKGYGVATLALPDGPGGGIPPAYRRLVQERQNASAAAGSAGAGAH